MLTSLLEDVGLPTQRGQLIGSLPTAAKVAIPGMLASQGVSDLETHFSHSEIYLAPGWLDTLDEILTGQRGLCSQLRGELADRERIVMSIICSEAEARDLVDELWKLDARCLCYWDEWRVHFDEAPHSGSEQEAEGAQQPCL